MSLIGGLTFALEKEGYEVTVARTSTEALTLWTDGKYDLAILDVSLPDGSGFDICKEIRPKASKLAVFLARIHALFRRSDNFSQPGRELVSDGICVNLLRGEVYKDGDAVKLTSGEYRLLCLFMENPGVLLSPERILASLWDCDGNFIDNRTLAVYIRRLRMKIENDPGKPEKIVTVRGMGYKWNGRV